jgi:hypothetical protein
MAAKRRILDNRDVAAILGAVILLLIGGMLINLSYHRPSAQTEMLRIYCLAVSSGLMTEEKAGGLLVQMRKDAEGLHNVIISTSTATENAIRELNRVPSMAECWTDVTYHWGAFLSGWLLVGIGLIGPVDHFRRSSRWNGTEGPSATKAAKNRK